MKKPKRETREPSNDITRTFDLFSGEEVETLTQDTKTPRQEDTNTPRQEDAKTQRRQEEETPRHKEGKISKNKSVTESMSKRDARSVTRDGYVYTPTNMMLRRDLHKALKMIALEEETAEYIILNKALEIHLKKLKKSLRKETKQALE